MKRPMTRAEDAHWEIDMSVHVFKSVGTVVLTVTMLSACGGGGGDPPETPNPPVLTSFALKAGYQARIVSGASEDFIVSGSCSGTARIATAPAIASTFEGVVGVSALQTSTLNFTTCSPASNSATGLTFYNANYAPIGSSVVGSEYAKFESPPLDWPAAVKVGQSGTVATLITYADSRFAVTTGKRIISYEIKADTATTAVANIITRSYDRVALLATETMSYRITENGVLTPVLLDVQFSTTSTLHLIYTPTPK